MDLFKMNADDLAPLLRSSQARELGKRFGFDPESIVSITVFSPSLGRGLTTISAEHVPEAHTPAQIVFFETPKGWFVRLLAANGRVMDNVGPFGTRDHAFRRAEKMKHEINPPRGAEEEIPVLETGQPKGATGKISTTVKPADILGGRKT